MVVLENIQSQTAFASEPEHVVQQRDRWPHGFDGAIDAFTVAASSDAPTVEAFSVVEHVRKHYSVHSVLRAAKT